MDKLRALIWSSPNNSSNWTTVSRYSSTVISLGLGSTWLGSGGLVFGVGMKKVGVGRYDGFGGLSGGDGVTSGVFLFFLLGDTAGDSAGGVTKGITGPVDCFSFFL